MSLRKPYVKPPRKPLVVPDVPPKVRGRYLRIDTDARATVPVPKFAYVRSEALMQAYRKIDCQACRRDDGTVAGAHSNFAAHGKGRGKKASDQYAASLCHRCHSRLDQGKDMSSEERKAFWWSAHVHTVALLVDLGLWPKGIDVPDTSVSPW